VSPLDASFQRAVLATDLDHVEGVCWDPVRRCLWAGGEAGQVYRVGLDGALDVVTVIEGGALLGLALDGAGALYVCDPGNHQVWRMDGDFALTPFGAAIDYPNYAAFAPDGRLFVSDSGSFHVPSGRIVVIDPDGATTQVATRTLSFANGLAIDETTLYVVESSAPGVSAMPLAGGPLEMVIAMERCVPDGLAFDARGGLLISCYQPNQIWRYSAETGLELVVDEWTGELILSPTNIAFYGERLDRLALASLCGHDLVSIAPPHPGAAVVRPSLPRESP
jgi:gluconolactonase